MTTYSELALISDIALPPLLKQLIDAGLADYGPDVKAWAADWKSHTLAARPVLSCVYDFEWIDAADAQENIDEWLNPGFQHGRRFLPFAQTGAGDLYCLTPLAGGETGVALVWHDRDASRIDAASFDAFVFSALIDSASDVSHLTDDGLSMAEAVQCLDANIRALAPMLPQPMQAQLEHIRQWVLSGADAEGDGRVPDAVAQTALGLLPVPQDPPFEIVPRWECGQD